MDKPKNDSPGRTSQDGGFRKPTMKDVAEASGVSVTTVSHVMNGTRYVSPEVTNKVKNAVESLNFKTNPIASNLRSGKSRVIGFVVSNLEHYFYVNIAKGIKKAVNSLGYQLILIDSAENKDIETKNIESLYLRGTDGIVIAPTTTDCGYLKDIVPPNFPLVFVDRQPASYQADCVLLNNAGASHEATRHLLDKGYTRIGFISFHFGERDIDPTIMERIEGYREAYREAGLPVDENLIQAVPGGSFSPAELLHAEPYALTRRMLGSPVQAILCGNSLAAIGVYQYLKNASISIPSRVALITFDDDLWLSMTSPRISSVAQPAESIGFTAAKQLLKRIQAKAGAYKTIRLDAELIFRESC
ncbi:MAG: LacI family transcriptional regulator [Treponema sp.]|jgi:LacI family transcriptional regulator|nr:LacI family transcriptional regulator [Treponema sp.]